MGPNDCLKFSVQKMCIRTDVHLGLEKCGLYNIASAPKDLCDTRERQKTPGLPGLGHISLIPLSTSQFKANN
jgi:hypothetical protein